jgi:hypothetical protein
MTQRRLADAGRVMRIDFCAGGEQHERNLEVLLFDGVVQRRTAEIIERRDLRTRREQRANLREISVRRRQMQLLALLPVVFRWCGTRYAA